MYNFQSAVFEQFLFLILTIFKLISSCVHPKFYVYKSRNLAVYNTIINVPKFNAHWIKTLVRTHVLGDAIYYCATLIP